MLDLDSMDARPAQLADRRGRPAGGGRRAPHRPDGRHRRHHPGRAGPGDPRDLAGVLVVQGGPGTGKTAVALHRAAYLLYTHRERLSRARRAARRARTRCSCATSSRCCPRSARPASCCRPPAELYPGVERGRTSRAPRWPRSRATCGWPGSSPARSRARQRVPERQPGARRSTASGSTLTPADVAAARARARRSRKPHNVAREGFLQRPARPCSPAELAEQHAAPTLTSDNREDLLEDLRDVPDVRRELNLAWMPLSAEQLLARPVRRPGPAGGRGARPRPAGARAAAPGPRRAWTVADVPLLDEAAELLGDDDVRRPGGRGGGPGPARRGHRATRRRRCATCDSAIRPTAEQLAERFAESGPALTVAERAERDRTWAFGHVVVDEAQELSPMMWRLLMRRCPTRSMTLVGDVAQVGLRRRRVVLGRGARPVRRRAAGGWPS